MVHLIGRKFSNMKLKNLKLNEVLFLQSFGVNKSKYAFLGVKAHMGIDLSVGINKPLPNFAAGTVVYADHEQGTLALIDDLYEYSYSHLNEIFVKVGQYVEEGVELGLQGNKGATIADGEGWSHVHFGIRGILRGLKSTDKLIWDFPSWSPLPYQVKDIKNGFEGYINPAKLFPLVVERVADAQEEFEDNNPLYNNPGALRWSPFQTGSIIDSTGKPMATFSSKELGRKAQIHQLTIMANGKSERGYKPWMVFRQALNIYAPPTDRNSKESLDNYDNFINDRCGFYPYNVIGDWLLTELEWISKNNRVEQPGLWVESPIIKSFNILWNNWMKYLKK